MFFLQFEATPGAEHPESAELGGAFISCWIKATSITEAKRRARRDIAEQRWIVDDLEKGHSVDHSFYDDDDTKGLPYFEQALIDNEVYVFDTYPVIDEEE